MSRDRMFPAMAIALIAIAVIWGGASRLDIVAPILPRLFAVFVLAWLAWTAPAAVGPIARPIWWFWIALLALPLIQLVPLPWQVWTALPGRELPRDIYRSVGETPWLPISLTPSRTLNGLLALLPAFAAFVLATRLKVSARDLVLKAVAILAVASAMLGLLQVGSGPQGGLYFYAITNADSGVGWFSNANHNALMLCTGIVCVCYWIAGDLREARRYPWGRIVTALAAIATLLACLPLTASRAGVLLSLVALGGGATLLPLNRIGVSRRRASLGLLGATGLLAGTMVALGYEQIFGSAGAASLLTDARARNLGDFARITATYFPFGSGLGSFDPVYRIFEPVETIQLNYLNNAHNEPAQILVEAGVFGLALMLGYLCWLAMTAWRVFHRRADGVLQTRQARAAILIIAMLTAHSLVDYPLRTAALSTIFAFCAGLVAARGLVVSGRSRGLALSAWIGTHDRPDFRFPTGVARHMTTA